MTINVKPIGSRPRSMFEIEEFRTKSKRFKQSENNTRKNVIIKQHYRILTLYSNTHNSISIHFRFSHHPHSSIHFHHAHPAHSHRHYTITHTHTRTRTRKLPIPVPPEWVYLYTHRYARYILFHYTRCSHYTSRIKINIRLTIEHITCVVSSWFVSFPIDVT